MRTVLRYGPDGVHSLQMDGCNHKLDAPEIVARSTCTPELGEARDMAWVGVLLEDQSNGEDTRGRYHSRLIGESDGELHS